MTQIAKIIVMAPLLDGVTAQDGEEEEPGNSEFRVTAVFFALLIILATLAVQWLVGGFLEGSATKESSVTKKVSTTSRKGGGDSESPKVERSSHFQNQRLWVNRHRLVIRRPGPSLVVMHRGLEENLRLRSHLVVMRCGFEENPQLRSHLMYPAVDASWVGGKPATTLPAATSEVSGGDAPWVGGEPAAMLPSVTSSESSESSTSQPGVTEERVLAV